MNQLRVLTPDELRTLLTRFKAGLADLYGERLHGIYLFGSYSRGEARDDSDVDVLVVLDRVERYGEEIWRTSNLVGELSLEYAVTVSRVFAAQRAWSARSTNFLRNVREDALTV